MKTQPETCRRCGKSGILKVGWTCGLYCSEECERRDVSDLHASMPGAGPLPRLGWVPHFIQLEMKRRWSDTETRGGG